MHRHIPSPFDPTEMRAFLDTFMYEEAAFLPDEILEADETARSIVARMDTTRQLPYVELQRAWPGHPAHVSVGELVMATAHMGSLHGWFFYGLRWNEGWVGYGNRIHRADFKSLAHVGPPLILRSQETASRIGTRRIIVRFNFEFTQQGSPVYVGDQTAMFVKNGQRGSLMPNGATTARPR